MSNSEVAVRAVAVTPATVELRSAAGASSPGIRISLDTPEGTRGNGWGVSAEYVRDETVIVADAEARILRITMSATAADRTLGALFDAISALDHDSLGNPFDAEVAYIDSGAAATLITRTAATLATGATLFADGETDASPPVDLSTQGSLTAGEQYRLQAQTSGEIWITEQPTADGAPDTATIGAFRLPLFTDYYVEQETDKTIWVFAAIEDGVVGING